MQKLLSLTILATFFLIVLVIFLEFELFSSPLWLVYVLLCAAERSLLPESVVSAMVWGKWYKWCLVFQFRSLILRRFTTLYKMYFGCGL